MTTKSKPKLVQIAHDQISFLKSENHYYIVVFGKGGGIWKYKILPENKIFVDHILQLRKEESLKNERMLEESAVKQSAKVFGFPYLKNPEKIISNLMSLELIPYDICTDLKIVCFAAFGQLIKIAVTTNNQKIQDYLAGFLENYSDKEVVIHFVSESGFNSLMAQYRNLGGFNGDGIDNNEFEIEKKAYVQSRINSLKSFLDLIRLTRGKVLGAKVIRIGRDSSLNSLKGFLKIKTFEISTVDRDGKKVKVVREVTNSIEKDVFEIILLSFCHGMILSVDSQLLHESLVHGTTQLQVTGQFPANDILWQELLS